MILSVHQPQYIPWLGYFDKIDRADIFVFLDNVQYKKNEWQNRNRIKTAQGRQWLTVPVLYRFGEKIFQVAIDNKANWPNKHWQALVTNYSKANYFHMYKDFFKETYSRKWQCLAELNIHIIKYLIERLGITPERVLRASELKLDEEPTQRLVDICKQVGADTYLSGQGGRDYLDLKRFVRAGIEVIFQDFRHPIYRQLYARDGGFQPGMSIIDLLFNCGQDSLSLLRNERETKKV